MGVFGCVFDCVNMSSICILGVSVCLSVYIKAKLCIDVHMHMYVRE